MANLDTLLEYIDEFFKDKKYFVGSLLVVKNKENTDVIEEFKLFLKNKMS
jgi:hypothetical protein